MAKIMTLRWAEYKQMSLPSVLQDQGPGCLLEIGLGALGTITSFITSVLNEGSKCVRFFLKWKTYAAYLEKKSTLILLA